jgi:hypothetical protein
MCTYALGDLLNHVGEGGVRVGLAHALELTPRGETDTTALLAEDLDNTLEGLDGEAGTVLDGTTVAVGTLVADGLQVLVKQITVGAVNLVAVETSLESVAGRRLVGIEVAGGVFLVEDLVNGLATLERLVGRRNNLDVRLLAVVCTTKSPALQPDQTVLLMNASSDLLPGLDLLARVNPRGGGVTASLLRDEGSLGDEKTVLRCALVVVPDKSA